MKKLLLLSIITLLASLPSVAQQLKFKTSKATPVLSSAPAKVEAENQAVISYCGEYYQGIGAGAVKTSAAIEVPAGMAVAYKGAKLASVSIGVGSPCSSKQLTIFLTKKLGETPFYTETVDIKSINSWNLFTLATPYVIEGERFFIGYDINAASGDFPLGVDGKASSCSFGNYIAIDDEWANMPAYGLDYNVCIRGNVEGATAPELLVDVQSVTPSNPTVKTDTPFAITSTLYNLGKNKIDSIDVTYQLGNMEPLVRSYKLTTPVAVGSTVNIKITDAVISTEGMNTPISVTVNKINGEDVPQTSASSTVNVWNSPLVELTKVVPSVTILKTGETFTITTTILNNGADKVKKIEAVYEIGNQEPVTMTHSFPFGISTTKTNTFKNTTASCTTEGIHTPLKVTITSVDGVEISPVSATGIVNASNTTFDRNVVVEEGTGTWCGWCPRGIVGMEYMNETYPDSFIGIAVHVGDEMQADTYAYYYPAEGFPTSNVDRRFFGLDPTNAKLETAYTTQRKVPGFAKVGIKNVTVNDADKTATITTDVAFGIDADNSNDDFRLSYVVLEHKVGPYFQSNYYAGGSNGALGGWESKSSTASTIYNDVARDIFDYNGIIGTVPATIKAGTDYEHTNTVSLRNVTKLENVAIAVLLLDAVDGTIVNAAKWSKNDAGVEDIVADVDNAVKVVTGAGYINVVGEYDMVYVYSVDGKLVAATSDSTIAVPSGAYIVKVNNGANSTVKKVFVRP